MFSAVEDEDLFNPTSTSNLATLFGTSMTLKQDSDASLTYTAPKQPKASGQETPKTSPKPAAQSSVICTKFVDVFKLSERIHVSQGKCGLAIIGNESLKAYEVIIYKSKQDIIMRTKLKPDFVFTIQDNDFAHFCDDQKQQWSVHFENTKEIHYFVQQIETRGGRVVSNNKNTGVSDAFQTNVEVKPKVEESPSFIGSPIVVKDNKDSDSLSDNSSSQTKANILSRMAKMGQSILPTNLPKQSSDHSDSETDEQELNRKSVKERKKYRTAKEDYVSTDKEKTASNSQSISNPITPLSEFVIINGQIMPVSTIKEHLPTSFPNTVQNQFVPTIPNQIMLTQPQVSPITDSLHVFIAENRTHNCEARMNMTQMSLKLDRIFDKLNKTDHANFHQTPGIDELQLAEELEKNKALVRNVEDQKNKLQESLINNQQIIDDLKQQNEDQKIKLFEQEQRIKELEHCKLVLEEQSTHNNTFQQEIEEQQQTITNLKQTISDQESNLESLTKFYKENQKSSTVIDELNKSVTNLRSQLSNKNSKSELFATKLKQSMNLLYQEIMENFEDDSTTFQSVQIKQILSQKLKVATFTIIQEFHSDFKDSHIAPPMDNSNPVSLVP